MTLPQKRDMLYKTIRKRTGMDKDKNERTIEYLEDSSALVGRRRRELVDRNTGEVLEVEQTTRLVYGSKSFWKCYLKELVAVLRSLNSKQFNVFTYIIEHARPSDNLFIGTYDKIMKDTGCCRQTVAVSMKKLQENGFIKKVQNGVWIINPDVLMKGNANKYRMLRSSYKNGKLMEKEKKADTAGT